MQVGSSSGLPKFAAEGVGDGFGSCVSMLVSQIISNATKPNFAMPGRGADALLRDARINQFVSSYFLRADTSLVAVVVLAI